MRIESRLKEMGIRLPEVNKPLASYLPGVRAGEYIYISGQFPMQGGKLLYSGKLGLDLSIAEGQAASRLAAINCLAVLKSLISDWSQVKRIIKINGFINSAPGFYEQPQVLNGASDLVVEVWGEIGQHARAAVGVSDLPLNAPCEIDMIIQVQ